ncbi:YppG family protein [Lentibacillus amyloliquefaciens]|uniref:YppG-like protein n=1 Tax=Lentibacillus amyloliquefaciens TaxID=1472767 RepID=A0A0U3W7T8_9BACI|nr:YppG family protein [Lentibacillus amyloliquefaciens]ALX49154.1 hypothetical protein AOX59_11500 [Lentibacillus amyloliquefaciens]
MEKSGPFLPSFKNYSTHSPAGSQPINTSYHAHYPTAFEVFAKPKQPMYGPYTYGYEAFSQPSSNKQLKSYFQDHNGQLDLEKMLSTAGQVANTVKQISPVVKDVSQLMKQL